MLMRKFAATSALLIAAMGVAAGTAHADEAPAPVQYTATTTETESIITVEQGSLAIEDGALKIKNNVGTTIAGTPLTFRLDDFELPIAAELTGNTVKLAPVADVTKAVYKPVALPYEDKAPWKNEYEREQAAWSRLTSTISMGATIGTLVGGIGGAAAGCVIGAGIGLVLTGALLTLFGAGPIAGCVAGAAAVGFLGVLAGQIFVTAPFAIGAAIQYFSTIAGPAPVAPAK
ncbi:hypothetical protein ACFWUP_19900 [Nocardia sp. NPDC058658]|uniref:hypothetical protein n=1 Tax=Nocardia sp. NPDC058658 TaxID=3346580 RepID=UPI00365D2217